MRYLFKLAVCCLSMALALPAAARPTDKDKANELYRSWQSSIYQIRIIENNSKEKASIGSGFQLSGDGLIATNYHVISSIADAAERYKMEYVAQDGSVGPLQLVAVDVVHDLAIVKREPPHDIPAIPLSQQPAGQGNRLYSMGNPHDLGMAVVEGTYNGLLSRSLYERIFFSGSINPGMSGGPALNAAGEVIGVNVATAGEQISFLVPVSYLQKLLNAVQQGAAGPLDHQIESQLTANQDRYIQALLQQQWQQQPLGKTLVPGEIADFVRCWGDTDRNTDSKVKITYRTCRSEDEIYLNEHFTTGTIAYSFDWLTSDDLLATQFYTRLSRSFQDGMSANRANKRDVKNFNCHTRFVTVNDSNWKVVMCARPYKKYPSLFDLIVLMASVDHKQEGLVGYLSATGVSQSNAEALSKRFMEHVKWN